MIMNVSRRTYTRMKYKADSWLAPSHRETSLQSYAVSHWLDANLESALIFIITYMVIQYNGYQNDISPFIYTAVSQNRTQELPRIGHNECKKWSMCKQKKYMGSGASRRQDEFGLIWR